MSDLIDKWEKQDEETLKKANRICREYKHGDETPYRFCENTLLHFAQEIRAIEKLNNGDTHEG